MNGQNTESDKERENICDNGYIVPNDRVNIVVGAFGSGKTEVSVNWSIALSAHGHAVRLADLDMANPYFRTREAQQLLRSKGVTPVIPSGEVQFSDLPVLIPQIKGMLQHVSDKDICIFDVGGDEPGAKVLASLRSAIGDTVYSLYQVINGRRPFTNTLQGCIEMKENIERVSGLHVTNYIINTHLMDLTTDSIVREGLILGENLSLETNIPVAFAAVMEDTVDVVKLRKTSRYPIAVMKRVMLPPWLNVNAAQSWPLAVAERKGR
ncbi:MAG: cobalamin biosynthesis protein CbiA [Deltaproteobacteria bacterium]|nr:cobalamin biosynthesis protein CbiA [Deltaproteobacteria bacterium]